MAKLTEQQIKDATQANIRRALAHVQRAQDELGRACSELSALQWGAPTHRKGSKLYDQVHAFWYTVQGLQYNSKVRLDPTNIEALERQLEQKAATAKEQQGG